MTASAVLVMHQPIASQALNTSVQSRSGINSSLRLTLSANHVPVVDIIRTVQGGGMRWPSSALSLRVAATNLAVTVAGPIRVVGAALLF